MNPGSLLDSPFVTRLGWALVHSLWEIAAVAGVFAVVHVATSRASSGTRYWLACAAMGLAAALPCVTFFVIHAETGGDARPIATAVVPNSSVPRAQLPIGASAPVHAIVRAPESTPGRVPTPGSIEVRAVPQSVEASARHFIPWVVFAWMAGVILLSVWHLGGWIALQGLKRIAVRPASGEIAAACARLCRRMRIGRTVRILESVLTQTPMVIGWVRPVILMPVSVLGELPVDQVEALLAHELAHVRRFDYLANLVQTVVETLLFYHPAVWWVSRVVRAERENCCDDVALSVTARRDSYARALAAVAEASGNLLAPAASGGLLLKRIRRVLGVPEGDEMGGPRWVAGATLVVLVAFALIPALLPPQARAKSMPVNAGDGKDTKEELSHSQPAFVPSHFTGADVGADSEGIDVDDAHLKLMELRVESFRIEIEAAKAQAKKDAVDLERKKNLLAYRSISVGEVEEAELQVTIDGLKVKAAMNSLETAQAQLLELKAGIEQKRHRRESDAASKISPREGQEITRDQANSGPLQRLVEAERSRLEKDIAADRQALDRARRDVLAVVEKMAAARGSNDPKGSVAAYFSELQSRGDLMVRLDAALRKDLEAVAALAKDDHPVIGVEGRVAHPGLMLFTPGLDVMKAVTDAGIELNDPAYTVISIKRTDSSGTRVSLPTFTFADLKRGKAPEVHLMPNDLIEVRRPDAGKWGH